MGDLPVPWTSPSQTASLVLDVDGDGIDDFVIASRRSGQSMVWYHREPSGWTQYLIEGQTISIEAGGTFWDMDGDGDQDIVMGGDSDSNQVWWWENPAENPSLLYDPGRSWTRREIKSSGSNKHHDQIFGDFDGDGQGELVFWNQQASKLFLANIPQDPKNTQPWTLYEIYGWSGGKEHEGLARADINGDGQEDIVGGGRWFEHQGGTNYTPHVIDDGQRFARAAAGQLKAGGWSEVVFVPGDAVGRLTWYEWNGSQWVGHDLLGFDVDHGHSLQVADINGDGHLDIFAAEMRLNEGNPDAKMWVFLGDGAGGFELTEVATGYGNHESRVGDLDGDGDLDILGKPYNWDSPRVDVWLNSGTDLDTPTRGSPTDTPTPTEEPAPCDPSPRNIVANPGFESGTSNWTYHTSGGGGFSATIPPAQCALAARLTVANPSSNIQLHQRGIRLTANTRYRLRFAARSTTGHNLDVYLQKDGAPYTNYGLSWSGVDLSPSWQVFVTEFTTAGFSGTVQDGRLRFWLAGDAQAGDEYWIDDIVLEEATTPTASPTPTATATAPPRASHTPAPAPTPGAAPCTTGSLLREWWLGISGAAVSDLTGHARYPHIPSGSNQPASFEAPVDWAGEYGTRMRGYLVPPASGEYTFWIASDDQSELWLSSDESPRHVVQIASVPGRTMPREWDRYPAQQSAPVALQAGQAYYVEALHKEGSGRDSLAVAWQPPGGVPAVIEGVYLCPYSSALSRILR
jgi:hypothetical protein